MAMVSLFWLDKHCDLKQADEQLPDRNAAANVPVLKAKSDVYTIRSRALFREHMVPCIHNASQR
jgi:hypothetical protein